MKKNSFFEITHKDKKTRARTGLIRTDHGDIETPVFMPVGTQAAIKTLDQSDMIALGAQIILGNTYHLHLRPGEDLIAKFGGLHKFMNWDKPILTDSGGFQVFSLKHKNISRFCCGAKSRILDSAKTESGKTFTTLNSSPAGSNLTGQEQKNDKSQGALVNIDEDGVTFTSHLDGSKHYFTPEKAIDIQYKIGADIIMAFDECAPDSANFEYAKESMERTHRWAERCIAEHKKHKIYPVKSRKAGISAKPKLFNRASKQFLFGIIQGANHKGLRQESAKFISALNFDGIAVGGESIGYNMKATKKILDWTYPLIPENKPHYAMGVGLSPADLLEVIESGIDMFDCVAPTRLGRHGMVFIRDAKNKFRLNITNAAFAKDKNPIDKKCSCSTCKNYSRAYLRHLFVADEMTGMRLATIHNIHFLLNLMKEAREAIKNNKFSEFKRSWYK